MAGVGLVGGLLSACEHKTSAKVQTAAKTWAPSPPPGFDGKDIDSQDFSQVKDALAAEARLSLQDKSWRPLTDKEAIDLALKPLNMRKGVSAYLVRCLTYFSPPSEIEGSTGKYLVSFDADKGVVVSFGALGSGFDPLCETLVVLLPAAPKAVYAWLSLDK